MKYIVYIGRFQPFHFAHMAAVKKALAQGQNVVLALGSSNCEVSVKNPFTADERKFMISKCFSADELSRLHFTCLDDYPNQNELWIQAVYAKIADMSNNCNDEQIGLIGLDKDSSTFYLSTLSKWHLIQADDNLVLNATDIRKYMFENSNSDDWSELQKYVPLPIYDYLLEFKKSDKYKYLLQTYDK